MTEPEVPPKARRPRLPLVLGIVGVALVALLVAGVAVPLASTSTPDFFKRYHLLNRRYVNLEHSAHEGIGCRACHETQPLQNAVELTADYYRSLVTTDQVPKNFTFGKPRREACLRCHADEWAEDAERIDRIPHPAHQRVAEEERECVECHKWTAHFETYMTKHKEMPFSGVCVAYGCHVGTKTSDQCYDCHHILHEAGEQWQVKHPEVVKANGQNACLESCHTGEQCRQCHTTGQRPEFTGQKVETSMRAIEELHVRPDWTEQFHGSEALKDRDKCLLCHQAEGECDECHLQRPAFHGSTDTWIGRHSKATSDVEDPRCIECHEKVYCEECHQQFKEME